MHNLKGALSESLYIYQPVIAHSWEGGPFKSMLSVGLGLGYNEMIVAAEAIRGAWTSYYLESFESQDLLRDLLLDWLRGESHNGVHNLLSQGLCRHYQLDPEEVRCFLLRALELGHWKIRGAIDSDTQFECPFNGLLFDAYSSKTSPELWDRRVSGRSFVECHSTKLCFEYIRRKV